MTAFVLGLPEHKVRVIAPDVGGGFGSKIYLYAEETALVWASQARQPPDQVDGRAQRSVPVRRARPRPRHARRARARQGRQVPRAARAHDREHGRVPVDVRVVHPDDPLRDAARRPVHDAGDLLRGDGGRSPTPRRSMPIAAPGRPEATYVVERIVAPGGASSSSIEQDEIRRRNFIRTFPYQTPVALHYDTGDYDATLDEAMKMADVAGFPARKAEAAKRGKLRGLGYASYIEACGIAPSNVAGALGARAGLFEAGEVRVHPTGSVTVFTGSHSHGQGHETTFAQVVADAARHRRSTTSTSCTATPAASRSAWAPTARARSRSAARRSSRRSTRSSPRARRSPRTCWRRRRPTSSSRTASSRSPAPTAARRSARSRSPPTCRTTIRSTSSSPASNETAFYDPTNFTYPGGHAHLRGRGRSGHRRRADRQLHRVRRLRQHHQPDDRRRPGARRRRAGHRPGAARELRLRQGQRASS